MINRTRSVFTKRAVRALAFISILAGSSAYASADTIWNLVNVTFNDTATAKGFFQINSTFDTLTDWNINVQGSNIIGVDYDYTPANSNQFGISSTEVELGSNPFASFTIVVPTSAMTNAGGTINLDTNSSIDCGTTLCGTLVTGQITTNSASGVPEPSSFVLSASGACILGFVLYRRRRALTAYR